MNKILPVVLLLLTIISPHFSTYALQSSASNLGQIQKSTEKNQDYAMQLAIAYLDDSSGLNTDKAVYWLKEVLKLKDSKNNLAQLAAYKLGQLHMGLNNYPIDETLAKQYFKLASANIELTKLYDAPYQLAMLTTEKNEYLSYLKKSADYDFLPAIMALVQAYSVGDKNVNDYIFWLTKAANLGDYWSQLVLGQTYYYGNKTSKNYDYALHWLIQAAAQKETEAQQLISSIYFGNFANEDTKKNARKWFELSAEKGNIFAKESLAYILIRSAEVVENTKGVALFLSLAENGSKDAAIRLAAIYRNGELVQRSELKARLWINKAESMDKLDHDQVANSQKQTTVNSKYSDASFHSTLLFHQGMSFHIDKEYLKAQVFLEKSARMKFPLAQYNLAVNYIEYAKSIQDIKPFNQAIAWARVAEYYEFADATVLVDQLANATINRHQILTQSNLLYVKIMLELESNFTLPTADLFHRNDNDWISTRTSIEKETLKHSLTYENKKGDSIIVVDTYAQIFQYSARGDFKIIAYVLYDHGVYKLYIYDLRSNKTKVVDSVYDNKPSKLHFKNNDIVEICHENICESYNVMVEN